VIYSEYSLIQAAEHSLNSEKKYLDRSVVNYIEYKSKDFFNSDKCNYLIFFIYYTDFNCPPCFEDFIDLSDSIQSNNNYKMKEKVIALFYPDEEMVPRINSGKINRLLEANQIKYQYLIGYDSLFIKTGIKKSSLAIIDKYGKLKLFEQIPVGKENQKKIIEMLK